MSLEETIMVLNFVTIGFALPPMLASAADAFPILKYQQQGHATRNAISFKIRIELEHHVQRMSAMQ